MFEFVTPNRTIVELKCVIRFAGSDCEAAPNRTIVELKWPRKDWSSYCGHLLIVQ